MREYAVSVFVISAIVAILTLLLYRGAGDAMTKFAFLVLLLYTVCSPLPSLLGEMSGALDFSIDDFTYDNYGDDYIRVAEDAFALGIRELICDEFSLNSEGVDVHIIGFDFEQMRAERIRVILSAVCAFADVAGIERLVEQYGMGECDVCFEI